MKNQNIIKKNHHFQKIINKKRFVKSQAFIVYYSNDWQEIFKYGISVGKKLGNAVFRNKIKRQIRHMIYQLLPELILKKTQIIIMARKQITNQSYNSNLIELKKLLNKIN